MNRGMENVELLIIILLRFEFCSNCVVFENQVASTNSMEVVFRMTLSVHPMADKLPTYRL
jgi:hypothetical protein